MGVATGRVERSEGRGTKCTLIRFGSYNIWNGRNGGLENTLQGMAQANMELGVL